MSRNKTELFRLNKNAFDEIIGDPTGYPEPITGQFLTFNTRSSIKTTTSDLGVGKGTSNPATPSVSDFCCDVENAVHLGLVQYARGDKQEAVKLLTIFLNTYIVEDEKRDSFDSKERRAIEQVIGRIFLQRRISPVRSYFLTIRRKVN
jgi:hypothetical protein